ncbi:Sua5/YciO/YrdC/YwlC family protein [Candidatus Saccharibacteria bacterium]|nr:Sua5/YciO/YrdC/YwlC family protein [Candidatus Saccharibacteria bacterium]
MSQPKSSKNVPAKNKSGVFRVKTDTVWGWGAWLRDAPGIRELMERKSRGLEDKKVFALVLGWQDLTSGRYVVLDDFARELVEKYREAPLTLVLPKSAEFRHWYYDNFPEIGVRLPSTENLRAMAAKGPFLLTSANARGGEPEPIAGPPTTVARVAAGRVEILRQGEIELK